MLNWNWRDGNQRKEDRLNCLKFDQGILIFFDGGHIEIRVIFTKSGAIEAAKHHRDYTCKEVKFSFHRCITKLQ